VHDTFLVHVLKCKGYLVSVLKNSLFGHRNVLLYVALDDKFQVSLFCPLDRNKELVQLGVNKPTQILYDVWLV
jgi:hypothetical protein